MYSHGDLGYIPFNFNMQMATFNLKIMTFDPTPGVEGVFMDIILYACMVLSAPLL